MPIQLPGFVQLGISYVQGLFPNRSHSTERPRISPHSVDGDTYVPQSLFLDNVISSPETNALPHSWLDNIAGFFRTLFRSQTSYERVAGWQREFDNMPPDIRNIFEREQSTTGSITLEYRPHEAERAEADRRRAEQYVNQHVQDPAFRRLLLSGLGGLQQAVIRPEDLELQQIAESLEQFPPGRVGGWMARIRSPHIPAVQFMQGNTVAPADNPLTSA